MALHQEDDESGQVALVAEAIGKWAAKQPKWMPLPSDDSMLGDLDFAPEDYVVRLAKKRLVDEGAIGLDDDGYYFVAMGSATSQRT